MAKKIKLSKGQSLKSMGTKKYLKQREAHNTWWGNVCRSLIQGDSYEDALKINTISK